MPGIACKAVSTKFAQVEKEGFPLWAHRGGRILTIRGGPFEYCDDRGVVGLQSEPALAAEKLEVQALVVGQVHREEGRFVVSVQLLDSSRHRSAIRRIAFRWSVQRTSRSKFFSASSAAG